MKRFDFYYAIYHLGFCFDSLCFATPVYHARGGAVVGALFFTGFPCVSI